jgi:hypothetical protein
VDLGDKVEIGKLVARLVKQGCEVLVVAVGSPYVVIQQDLVESLIHPKLTKLLGH